MLNKVASKDFLKNSGENLVEIGTYAAAGFVVGNVPGALGCVAFCLVRQGSSFVLAELVEKAAHKFEMLNSTIAKVALLLILTPVSFSLATMAASLCGMQVTWMTKVVLPLVATLVAKGAVYGTEYIYNRMVNPQAKQEAASVATAPLDNHSSSPGSIVEQLRIIERRSA